MTPKQALKQVEKVVFEYSSDAVMQVLKAGMRRARKDSSTTFSLKDRPFARRHGTPLRDPSIIGRRNGLFLSSWWIDRMGKEIDGGGALINDAPQADFLDKGTKFMFARPIRSNIEESMSEEAVKAEKQAASMIDWRFK